MDVPQIHERGRGSCTAEEPAIYTTHVVHVHTSEVITCLAVRGNVDLFYLSFPLSERS